MSALIYSAENRELKLGLWSPFSALWPGWSLAFWKLCKYKMTLKPKFGVHIKRAMSRFPSEFLDWSIRLLETGKMYLSSVVYASQWQQGTGISYSQSCWTCGCLCAKFLCLLFLNVSRKHREETCDMLNAYPAWAGAALIPAIQRFLLALQLSSLTSMVRFCWMGGCMPCCKPVSPSEASSLWMLAASVLGYIRDTLFWIWW